MSRTGINLDEVLPTNNVMFQMIFGDERHPRILIHFLNSVIKPETPIKKVSIRRESATNQDHVLDKCPRLDIIADTDIDFFESDCDYSEEDSGRLNVSWLKTETSFSNVFTPEDVLVEERLYCLWLAED